jgi:hypothetical protein
MRPFPISDVTGVYDIRLLNFKAILLAYIFKPNREVRVYWTESSESSTYTRFFHRGRSDPKHTTKHSVVYWTYISLIKSHKFKPTKYTVFREKYLIIYNLSPTYFSPSWAIIKVFN